LALGRLGDLSAIESVRVLAMGDQADVVRAYARVGLGLFDTAENRQLLAGEAGGPLGEVDALALGLTQHPDGLSIGAVQRTLQSGGPGPATAAAWALRQMAAAGGPNGLGQALTQAASPWVASEAILGLAGHEDAVGLLADILLAANGAKAVPAWRELKARDDEWLLLQAEVNQAKANYEQALKDAQLKWQQQLNQYHESVRQYPEAVREWKAQYGDAYSKWCEKYHIANNLQQQTNPNPPLPKPIPGPNVTVNNMPATVAILLGSERIYMSSLRASAAIALGQTDTPQSRQALRQALALPDDDYSDLYKGFVIISLGQLGDTESMNALANVLNAYQGAHVVASKEVRTSPLRGFAALALGLYARPIQTPQGSQDPPNYQEACKLLAARMADMHEEPKVRAAAAMALGLTGRTEMLQLLQPASLNVATNNEVIVGYTLLARGMLGDTNILPAAKEFLAVARDREDTAGILARRAAGLGVGVLGKTEGIPILVTSWDLSYYVSREVVLAFSLCRATSVTEQLVKLLKESPSPLGQAFAAQCLGELYSDKRPSRLAALINGSNYTIRNNSLAPYRAIANEFLYQYLLPMFGNQWQ
jgi:HEAT repeat protein